VRHDGQRRRLRLLAHEVIRTRHNAAMPRTSLTKAVGPVGMALTAWDVWRRLSPQQRRWITAQARTHGPRIAKQAWAAQQAKRNR
jgi:hypothetical protein